MPRYGGDLGPGTLGKGLRVKLTRTTLKPSSSATWRTSDIFPDPLAPVSRIESCIAYAKLAEARHEPRRSLSRPLADPLHGVGILADKTCQRGSAVVA